MDTLGWLDGRLAHLTDTLVRWSAINSGSANLAGLAAMADAIEREAAPLGAIARRVMPAPGLVVSDDGQPVQTEYGAALVLEKHSSAPMQVLLAGHMDTVFAAGHPFQTPNFRDPETLQGPGVADMKGGILVMLAALEALERGPHAGRIGWRVIINADEEISSPGSAALLAEAAGEADLGLLYEPAIDGRRMAGARKGSGNFTLVARGRAAHAGRDFAEGRNAVVAIARAIERLDRLNGQRDDVTVNCARIVGGGPLNLVPDMALCRFNVRVPTETDRLWVAERIRALVDDLNAGMQGGHPRLELSGGFSRPPKPVTADIARLQELVSDSGRTLGLAFDWVPTGGCCDGNNLAAAGLPNVDTLGVVGGGIHSSDEFVRLPSLVERAKLSALVLMRIAEGAFVPSRRREVS